MRGMGGVPTVNRLAAAIALLFSTLGVAFALPSPVGAADATSAFVATQPCRLTDVRYGTGFERVDAQIVRVAVADRCSIPADAVSLALTVTVDNSLTVGSGYASIWPEGQPIPTASIINYFQGEVRANGTIVAIGVGRAIDIYTLNGAPVIVDVTGWFVATPATASGRFVPISPTRAIDTRLTPRGWPLAAGETITVPLPAGVPTDAVAVAATITITQSAGPGFFSVAPAGTAPPPTSVVNADRAMQTRAAGTIVGVTAAGLDVFSSHGGHLVVDVTGWFTGASAAVDDDGLFVAAPAPRRLLDTRPGNPVWAGGEVEIANVAANAGALAVNVAVVNPMQPGFLTTYPARQGLPVASTVNANYSGDIAASMAIVPTSVVGLTTYASGGADVVVDLSGWFIGTPGPAPGAEAVNRRPPVCVNTTDPDGLNRMFRSGALIRGADYQKPFALPDGRVLWFFQDAFLTSRAGTSRLIHNVGLIQTGACFELLSTGDFTNPREYLFAGDTQFQQRWFWPLSGDMGTDGRFHMFVAEMRERGTYYLNKVEPVATWIVTIDINTLTVVDQRPAPNPSAALYGFSVTSSDSFTYLYAHCYRQFGWDIFPFSSPPVYVHDWDCADDVTVGRIPKGQFDQTPTYWNGSTWGTNPANAVSIVPPGRLVSASQFYFDNGRWIAVTKIGDWWGNSVTIDVATRPQGPFTTVRTIPTPNRCDQCNNYGPSMLPYRGSDGSILLGLSHNRFDYHDNDWYDPIFFATSPF